MHSYLHIVKLVWPIALGMVNNALMQFVDRAFLAHDDMSSLEAVLPASTLSWVFLSFFQSVTGYAGVFVAQYHGAGEPDRCRASYHAALVLAALSAVLLLPLVPLGDWIFSLTAATPAIAAKECAYYDIGLYGGFFICGQMAVASYFTGRGLTRTVFWVNLAGNLLNVALDYLLIFGFTLPFAGLAVPALGIRGAALATIASQAVQFAVLAVAAGITRFHFDAELFRRMLRFGLPAGGYEILNMLSFTVFVFVTGTVGEVAFAASNACFTINYLLFAPTVGFSIGAQTLVGQALGGGNADTAAADFRRTLILGLGFVALTAAALLAFSGPILGLFAPDDPAIRPEFLSLGTRLLTIMLTWLLLDTLDTILAGALKGAGDTRFVFGWMLVSGFAVWLPLVFAVRWLGGSMVQLWLTMVLYVIVLAAGTVIRWRRGRWKSVLLVASADGKSSPPVSRS